MSATTASSPRASPPPLPGHDATSDEAAIAAAAAKDCVFSVRVVSVDYAMTRPVPGVDPYSTPFVAPTAPPLRRVPILRVFGATPAGQKACVHVHQVFPYFYVPYDGPNEPEQLQAYINRLGTSINQATAYSLGCRTEDVTFQHHVAAIVPVKGIPFYGFHAEYRYFLKIYI
ncbi:DNA polymerase zeta catalytic subunit [Cladochytrium tenue]|nr:DNA polymerase zeta catalytic subunit [Cladochytrium tenue]